MSHIAVANIFLESFTGDTSAQITRILRAQSESLGQTRKGRVWTLDLPHDSVNLTVSVQSTVSVLHDVEDDMLKLGCLPDDHPECITIVSARGRPEDLTACTNICRMLQEELSCKTSGAVLCS